MKMWKCKWGCVSFRHTPASPVDKPENAACWKVMSDQKSDVITSIKASRAQNSGRLGRGGQTKSQPRAVNHRIVGGTNVLSCVQGVWRRAARRGRGSRFQKGEMVQICDVQRLNHDHFGMSSKFCVTFGGLCQIHLSLKCAIEKFISTSGLSSFSHRKMIIKPSFCWQIYYYKMEST